MNQHLLFYLSQSVFIDLSLFISVYLSTLLPKQDVTQGQFLSRVKQVWILRFPSFRLVAIWKLKSPVHPIVTHSCRENSVNKDMLLNVLFYLKFFFFRLKQFSDVLGSEEIKMDKLRKLCFSGKSSTLFFLFCFVFLLLVVIINTPCIFLFSTSISLFHI